MEIVEALSTAGSVLLGLGGWKAIETLIFRKVIFRGKAAEAEAAEAEADVKEAEAKKAQVSAEEARFNLLERQLSLAEERNVRLHEQISSKEERFQEQTLELRKARNEAMHLTRQVGDLKAEIASLKAERLLKLCERRKCAERIPQSDY